MTEPGLREIATTTLRRRSGKIHNTVQNNNPILYKMNKAGNIILNETGRTLVEEVDFAENTTLKRYEGNETLDTSQAPVLTAFEYNWKQSAVAVVMNGLEEVQNGGVHQSINLLSGRIKNAERTIKNSIESDTRSDGTADGGKQIGGLDLLVPEDPTAGIVGGIDRSVAANAFARSYTKETATDASVTTIEGELRAAIVNTYRDGDKNRLFVLGNDYWTLLTEANTDRQRYVDSELAKMGFDNIMLDGVPCILGGGYSFAGTSYGGMKPDMAWLLNLDYLKLRVGKGRFFQPLKERESVNQDAMVKFLVFCGNLTCSQFGLQGRVWDS